MMSQPASIFVIVFTAINIAAALWLLWWTRRRKDENSGGGATTGHVWDGDLAEYNNPLPRWWLGLFIITVVFGVAYLAFYPGMGNFAGTFGWTAVDAHDEQVAKQRAAFEQRVASLQGKSLGELAVDPMAMATARNLFGANCAACHGSDARGARGYPNLTDQDWLYGGDEQTIYQTISGGRQGVMPPMGAVLGDDGVNEVASYVVSLSGGQAPADWVNAGKERFTTICAACHGADAKGTPALGAPNLTDGVWLHGGDFDTIRATITHGRNSRMPAHGELLGDSKVRLLAAYVLSLSTPASQLSAGEEEAPADRSEADLATAAADPAPTAAEVDGSLTRS